MEKITVVEKVETNEDKLKLYKGADAPDILLRLNEEYVQEKINFIFVNSIDKLLAQVFKTPVFFIPDNKIIFESPTPMAYKYSLNAPILYEIGQVNIGLLYTKQVESNLDTITNIDILLNRQKFVFAQYEIPIRCDANNLFTRVYIEESIHKNLLQVYHKRVLNWLKELPISVGGPNKIDKRLSTDIVKELGLEDVNTYIIEKLLVNFIMTNNYKELHKFIDMRMQAIEEQNVMKNIKTWNNFIKWIFHELNIEYTGNDLAYYKISSIEKKLIIKKKELIKNLFLNPCNHTINSPDLKLVGDFYQCSHGNNIKCRHYTYKTVDNLEKFYNEFSYTMDDNSIVCRICGGELISNPEFASIHDSPIAKKGIFEELNNYIFKKCVNYLVNIKYSAVVSSAFVNKIAGNISDSILNIMIGIFNKIDKTKGVQDNIVFAMKEITLAIYIYGSIILLITKNAGIMNFKGVSGTKYKDIFGAGLENLRSSIEGYMEKIKDIKTINLETSLQTVMEEIKSRNVVIPREFVKFNLKETSGYKYFESVGAVMTNYPAIEKYSAEDEVLYKSINSKLENIKYEELIEWHTYLKSVYKAPVYKYTIVERIPATTYRPPVLSPKYLGMLYGTKIKFHKHIFDLCEGGSPLAQIPLDKICKTRICSICKEEGKMNDLSEEYKDNLIYKSKEIFFRNYCIKNVSHKFNKEGKCECGYTLTDNSAFIKKNELPKINKFKILKYEANKEIYKEKDMPTVIPKFCGTLTKEQNRNFWNAFCCYEDTTYKDIIAGKIGNKLIAIPKILSQYSNLLNFIQLLGETKKLQNLHTTEDLSKLIINIKEILDNSFYYNMVSEQKYDYLRNRFIDIFNKLPTNIMEFYFKELIKLTQAGAMSEEHVKAQALINYKNKEVIENDVEEPTETNTAFTYEGFDYDGKNEKQ